MPYPTSTGAITVDIGQIDSNLPNPTASDIETALLPPGSLVYLKSGGPLMTVISVEESNKRNCTWFDATGDEGFLGGDAYFESFPVACLVGRIEVGE